MQPAKLYPLGCRQVNRPFSLSDLEAEAADCQGLMCPASFSSRASNWQSCYKQACPVLHSPVGPHLSSREDSASIATASGHSPS